MFLPKIFLGHSKSEWAVTPLLGVRMISYSYGVVFQLQQMNSDIALDWMINARYLAEICLRYAQDTPNGPDIFPEMCLR